ncbi:MAG: LysR family transcriptional regulator, partial [Oscillospiraceae bacterium]
MNINLEWYRFFREVAKCTSFSEAAKELFVSQSAVSQAIAHLEQSLHTALFVRSGRGVTLTGDGKLLHDYVESALGMLDRGEEKLEERAKLLAGEVKIAAADTISRHFLLPYLDRFNSRHSSIKMQVINRTSFQSLALLKSGAVDFAFVNLPIKEEGICIVKCMDIHDIFVGGSKYERLSHAPISTLELIRYPLIMLEEISNSRKYVDQYFVDQGTPAEAEIELGSHDLLLEFAKIGLGLSCVVKEFSEEYLEKGALFEIPLKNPIKKRSMGMCFLKNVPMSFAAEE